MANKLIGELVVALIETVAERLIAHFRLENVYELLATFAGLAFFVGGAFAWWMGCEVDRGCLDVGDGSDERLPHEIERGQSVN